jgi:hypothetical protein
MIVTVLILSKFKDSLVAVEDARSELSVLDNVFADLH